MDYNYNSYTQNNEPDYYEAYKKEQSKEARGVFSRFHFALVMYLVVSYAVSIIAEVAMLVTLGSIKAMSEFLASHRYVSWLLSFLPMYIVALPIFLLIIWKMKKMTFERSKMKASEFFSLFLIAQLAMWVGNIIGNSFNSFFANIKGGDVTDHTGELIEAMPVWLTLLIVVVVGPIIEELMFRKLMIDRLSRYGNTVAIIVSSISFGLFHGNLYQFFYAALIGVILGFMYAKTRNVLYPIAMHILVNFFGSVVPTPVIEKLDSLFAMIESLEAGIEVNMSEFIGSVMVVASYSIVQYAMLIGGGIMLYKFIKNQKYKIRDSWEYKLPREDAAGIIVGNVGTVVFIAASVLLFAYSIII